MAEFFVLVTEETCDFGEELESSSELIAPLVNLCLVDSPLSSTCNTKIKSMIIIIGL